VLDSVVDALVVKRVLMVAFHFPPLNVSSGIQRTLRFAQYLPDSGWEPIILTVHPRAYTGVSAESLDEVPPRLTVRRAFAIDAGRHLALKGRYPQWLAIPDRWWSWWLWAVPAGLALIREFKPDILWSTYPIATAHLVAYTLHRWTGLPWVADFRDPMAQDDYPPTPAEHRAYEWIEYRTLKHCERAVFTTQGAARLYANRYADVPPSRLTIIENGYDEAAFASAEKSHAAPRGPRPLRIVHSGTIYASERDPRTFLSALSVLKRRHEIDAASVRIVLRATGCDSYMSKLIDQHEVGDIVTLEPALPYGAALAEMIDADALLILQAANCNSQVPAKLYEYLRAKRPVLALTGPGGDTAAVLRNAGIDTIAPLDSEEEIVRLFRRFVGLLRRGEAPVAVSAAIASASRKARAVELAAVLHAATSRVAAPCTQDHEAAVNDEGA
jgi:glycosyltransferase involved in cell wall biosynthesis